MNDVKVRKYIPVRLLICIQESDAGRLDSDCYSTLAGKSPSISPSAVGWGMRYGDLIEEQIIYLFLFVNSD